MADEIFLASLRMDALIAGKVEQARRELVAEEAAATCGKCLNCQSDVAPPMRWCDPECRHDWYVRGGRSEIKRG